MNIWQSYKQERGCIVHFARLANTLLKDEESARDSHVRACDFAKYSLLFAYPVSLRKFYFDQTSDLLAAWRSG